VLDDQTRMRRLFHHHGLSIVMLGLFFVTFLVGQVVTGRNEYNEERRKNGESELGYRAYLASPHFGEATAENWESEFLQMFVFVIATAYLYQKGSAESKDPRQHGKQSARKPVTPDSPWPARRGGWVLRIYEHSLSGALFFIFALAWIWHTRAGHALYNEERRADGETAVSIGEYVTSSRFWFESFQNWQSEFLAIGAMVVLSIWLRERNSPESKEVETPHWENEE
jgi:hypothetical protein